MTVRPPLFTLLVLLTAAAPLIGCGGMAISYVPNTAATAPAPRTTVGLQVVDARSPEHGAMSPRVGQVRGSFGIPQGVDDRHKDVVPHTVGDATADALVHAGVTVQPGGKVLKTAVKEYWMDGFGGYKATITAFYELCDATGKVLWSSEITGASGGMLFTSGSIIKLFRGALTDLASHAQEAFVSAPFQQALAAQ